MKNKITKTSISKNTLGISYLVFIIYMFLFFLTFNNGIINISITAYSDELFLLLSTIVILFYILKDIEKRKIKKIYSILILYVIYEIINFYISPFNLHFSYTLAQSIINIKVFLVSFSIILIIKPSKKIFRLIKFIYFLFIFLVILGFVLNLLLQGQWNFLINHHDIIKYRYGFIRPLGWLGSTGQNSYFLSMTFVVLLLLYSKKPIIKSNVFVKKFFFFTLFDFLMAFPLTVRKGMMMLIPFSYISFDLLKGNRKIIFIFAGSIFLFIFLFIIKDMQIAQDTIINLKNMTTDTNNSYIRGLMIYHGFSLFLNFFPFGVGDATFGTVLSQYNTLDVYSYVGLNINSIYNNEGYLTGVYDSGFFSMLAENGFIGMVIIIVFVYCFFKFNKANLDEYNYIIFKIITWFTLLLSFTEPVWQNGMFTVIYTINLLFIYSKNNIYRINKKWVLLYPKDLEQ